MIQVIYMTFEKRYPNFTGLCDYYGKELYYGDTVEYRNVYVRNNALEHKFRHTSKIIIEKGCFGIRINNYFMPLYKLIFDDNRTMVIKI